MAKKVFLTGIIPAAFSGQRADQALAKLFPDYSRARLSEWLKNNQIKINEQFLRPKNKIQGNETVVIDAELEEEQWEAEAITMDIIAEDESLIVINKPAGLVVHPAQGNFEHTLVNALLHHCPELKHLPRAGLIHRLDKDTTGLLVIAKTLPAHHALVQAMQQREIQRTYQAIVYGKTPLQGSIREPIARHPRQRLKMSVNPSGKPAVTHYKKLHDYPPFSHLEVNLETGRTHQIRVHLAHIKHPILGDPLYGIKRPVKYDNVLPDTLQNALKQFTRQALHAWRLALIHPQTKEKMQWEAPLPDDMQNLLNLYEGGI